MIWKCAIAGIAMTMALAPATTQANSITDVENARAKERQGAYLTRQDIEQLRRYGSNDDYHYGYGPYVYRDEYYDDYDYDYGPTVEFGYYRY